MIKISISPEIIFKNNIAILIYGDNSVIYNLYIVKYLFYDYLSYNNQFFHLFFKLFWFYILIQFFK